LSNGQKNNTREIEMKELATDLEINMDRCRKLGVDAEFDGETWHIGPYETRDPKKALETLQYILGVLYG
jgi:hypothetical protein